jgi:glycine cleavage system H protein
MAERNYTDEHEWIEMDGDVATVGISDYAQEQLGDIVFIELPETGKSFAQGDEAAVIESVKAASELYAPVDGEVVAINDTLVEAPETINKDAFGAGWFIRLRVTNPSQLDGLMDDDAYKTFTDGLG